MESTQNSSAYVVGYQGSGSQEGGCSNTKVPQSVSLQYSISLSENSMLTVKALGINAGSTVSGPIHNCPSHSGILIWFFAGSILSIQSQ